MTHPTSYAGQADFNPREMAEKDPDSKFAVDAPVAKVKSALICMHGCI